MFHSERCISDAFTSEKGPYVFVQEIWTVTVGFWWGRLPRTCEQIKSGVRELRGLLLKESAILFSYSRSFCDHICGLKGVVGASL